MLTTSELARRRDENDQRFGPVTILDGHHLSARFACEHCHAPVSGLDVGTFVTCPECGWGVAHRYVGGLCQCGAEHPAVQIGRDAAASREKLAIDAIVR